MARKRNIRLTMEYLDRRALLSDGLAPVSPTDAILNAAQYAQQVAAAVPQIVQETAGYVVNALNTVANPVGAGYQAGAAAVQPAPTANEMTVILRPDPPPIQPDGTVHINPPTVSGQQSNPAIYYDVATPIIGADQVIDVPRVITAPATNPPTRPADPTGILEPETQPSGDVYRNHGQIDYDPYYAAPTPIT